MASSLVKNGTNQSLTWPSGLGEYRIPRLPAFRSWRYVSRWRIVRGAPCFEQVVSERRARMIAFEILTRTNWRLSSAFWSCPQKSPEMAKSTRFYSALLWSIGHLRKPWRSPRRGWYVRDRKQRRCEGKEGRRKENLCFYRTRTQRRHRGWIGR